MLAINSAATLLPAQCTHPSPVCPPSCVIKGGSCNFRGVGCLPASSALVDKQGQQGFWLSGPLRPCTSSRRRCRVVRASSSPSSKGGETSVRARKEGQSSRGPDTAQNAFHGIPYHI
eukprot:1161717-Pelagomonas_calceolata.AAC.8